MSDQPDRLEVIRAFVSDEWVATRDDAEWLMDQVLELRAQLAATHAAIRAMRDKVKDLEWGGVDEHVHGCCAFCLRFPVEGHEADCGMAALARLLGDPAQEQP